MELAELKNKILADINDFDKLLRDNFNFNNVRILHDDKVDYNSMFIHDDFISITLHDCAEIQDFIFINLIECDDNDKEYEWNGIKLYMHQYIDEMD